MKLAALIKEPPPGAMKTWGQVEHLLKSSKSPLYLIILNVTGSNPVLQFRDPAAHLSVVQDAIFYERTKERVAQQKFFNRDFLPTFFVFDNYMHVLGYETRLKQANMAVHYEKFE